MMKAIVLEIKDGVAAVLKEDGTVATTKQKCAVGDTIYLEEKQEIISLRGMRYAAAAAAVLITGIGGGSYLTASACSYVSLDVNPSVEFTLNRLNRVIDVTAVNEDAEALVEALRAGSVKNDTLQQALDKSVDFLSGEGYLDGEEDYLLLNVSSDDAKRSAKLEVEATQMLTGRFGSEGETEWIISFSDRQTRGYARELGISAGRYEEIRSIEEANDNVADAPGLNGEDKHFLDVETVGRYRDDSLEELFAKNGRIPDGDPQDGNPQDGGQPGDNPRDGRGESGNGSPQGGEGDGNVSPQGGNPQDGGQPGGENPQGGSGQPGDGNPQGGNGQPGGSNPQDGNGQLGDGNSQGGNGQPGDGNPQGGGQPGDGNPQDGGQPGDGNPQDGNGQPGDGNPQDGGQPGDGSPQDGGQPGDGNPQNGGQPGDGNPQNGGQPGGQTETR